MSAIGSLFSGSDKSQAPPPPTTSQFQPPDLTPQATGTTGNIAGLNAAQSQLIAQYLPFMNQQTQANTQGAQAGSLAATGAIPGATAIDQGSLAGGANLQGAAGNVLNTAFDPQNALYDRMFQQQQDQTNVTNAMYGVQSSPYGAGVADQANRNFNIDWQNQQLGRQIAGLGAAGTAYGQAAPMGLAAESQMAQEAALPFATTAAGAGANTQAIGQGVQQTGAAFQPQIQDLLQYLGWGTGATSVYNQGQIGGYGAATERQKANINQQKLGFGELGDVLNVGAAAFGA